MADAPKIIPVDTKVPAAVDSAKAEITGPVAETKPEAAPAVDKK